MKKKCIVLMLASCMLFSTITPAMAFEAKDVNSDYWGVEAIEHLNDAGVMNGFDGYFKPNDFISRVEFIAIINRAFGYEKTDLAKKFKDVDYSQNDWKTLEVMKASSQGFLVGSNGFANVEGNISREEAFAIISRVMKLEKSLEDTNFEDAKQISDWAKKDVAALWKAGYITGANNNINPKSNMTRAEAAKLVDNVMGTLINKAGEIDCANAVYNNVTINTSDVILKNTIINGNLYITEGVRSGEVTLDNVVVKGRTLISCGGKNSIKSKNSTLNNLVVNMPTNELVKIEATESSVIKVANILSEVEITTSDKVIIEELNLNASTNILGTGSIKVAYINSSNVNIAQVPDNIVLADGIVAKVNNKEVSSKKSIDDSFMAFNNTLKPIDKQKYSNDKFIAKPLIILMDFPNYKHTELDAKETDFRINAFKGSETTPEFYESLFFGDDFYKTSDGNEHITVNKFFLEESGGTYGFNGDVYGWYTAPKNIEYYGYNDPDYWDSDQKRAKELVEVAIEELIKNNPDIDLSKYDIEDKWDIDNDKNYNEPDGIIDTVVVLHAGLGEEWGGGSVGVDAIWPFRIGFSWYDNEFDLDNPLEAAKLIKADEKGNYPAHKFVDGKGKEWFAEDFTVFEQDLPLDLFCHEYGHVLGLPDLYSAGTPPVENWSIMGGSYTGNPRGSEPNSYGALCKEFLQKDFEKRGRNANWQNSIAINLEDIGKDGMNIELDQTSLKGKKNDSVIIKLPQKEGKRVITPTGSYAYFSDNKDNMENFMSLDSLKLVDIDALNSKITLSFDAWYGLDPGFDFFAVQAKIKGTDEWVALQDITGFSTDKVDAWIIDNETKEQIIERNPGWGITNDSAGKWVNVAYDLSKFIGKEIELRFRLKTDGNTPAQGVYIDNLNIKNGETVILSDDAEATSKFSLDGFLISNGKEAPADHYYILEWRNSGAGTLVDKGLKTINIGRPTLEYDPGLVVWYINEKYNGNTPDQNNYNHKNEQYAGIVDADQSPVWYKYETKDSEGADKVNYQMHDAAFSLRMGTKVLINGGTENDKYTVTDNQVFMNPSFSDGDDYTAIKSEPKQWVGVSLVKYGLKIFVTDESTDRSTVKIHIALDNDKNNKIAQTDTIISSIEINEHSLLINTDKKYGQNAYAKLVSKDGTEKSCVLNYVDGRYIAKGLFLGNENWEIKYLIFEDKDGNAKAIYNSNVNGIFGIDFNKLIK